MKQMNRIVILCLCFFLLSTGQGFAENKGKIRPLPKKIEASPQIKKANKDKVQDATLALTETLLSLEKPWRRNNKMR
jgi:hypothetical protein